MDKSVATEAKEISVWSSVICWSPFLTVAKTTREFQNFCDQGRGDFWGSLLKKVKAGEAKFFFAAPADNRSHVLAATTVTLSGENLHFHFYWTQKDDTVRENVFKVMLETIVAEHTPRKITFVTWPVPKDCADSRWIPFTLGRPVIDTLGRPFLWYTFTYVNMLRFADYQPSPPHDRAA